MTPAHTESQNQAILRAMQEGKKVNSLMAWLEFGCGALHSRMAQLRKEHEIKDRWIKVETSYGVKNVKEYWI